MDAARIRDRRLDASSSGSLRPVSVWRGVEIYGSFIRLTGELEIVGPERLSDSINRFGEFLQMRNARAEPLSVNYPVLSRLETRVTIAKRAVVLVCPLEVNAESNATMWRETVPHAASINTAVFSMVGDVHLLPGLNLQDHLERHPGDFLPMTNLSALWLTSSSGETHSLQRPLALLNPAAILSFS